ncbi:MAG: hypothetical protein JWN21_312 [Sphingomonas bacterium]|nr:hypothetical protein [Sphingomonas bacterium]
MTLFSLQSLDGTGRITSDQAIEVRDVYAALVRANYHMQELAHAPDAIASELPSRIDIADQDGQTVARLLRSEIMLTMA